MGIQLELTHGELASIASSGPIDPQFKFASVFTEWNKRNTPEYSWATIIDVLKTPAVNEQRLAEEVQAYVQLNYLWDILKVYYGDSCFV